MQPSTPTQPPVILDRITEVQVSDSGKPYFAAYFKAGLFGRPVRRAFFGQTHDDGSVSWERASPKALKPLVGQDLSSEAEVHAIDIEPISYTTKDGEMREMTSGRIVVFGDETVESAASIYRFTVRKTPTESALPPGHFVVSGDGAPA